MGPYNRHVCLCCAKTGFKGETILDLSSFLHSHSKGEGKDLKSVYTIHKLVFGYNENGSKTEDLFLLWRHLSLSCQNSLDEKRMRFSFHMIAPSKCSFLAKLELKILIQTLRKLSNFQPNDKNITSLLL